MARPPPLRVLSEVRPEQVVGLPILTAYGAPDDHLRLTVLMAETLRTRGAGVGLAQLEGRCRARENPWEARYEALWDMATAAEPRRDGSYFGVLVDPDALDPGPLGPETEWDDRDFGWQRSKFRELVERIVKRNGWIVVRPRPSPDVALPQPEPTSLDAPAPDLAELFAEVSPEIRPLLSWLVRSGNVAPRDVVRRFEAVGQDLGMLERRLISMVYNAISERAAEAAERLCIVRHAFRMDEQLGPHLVLDGGATVAVAEVLQDRSWLDRQALEELRAAGVLQPSLTRDGREAVRMPRSVRDFLMQEAEVANPGLIGRGHRWLATSRMEGTGIDSRLEAHHHAVRVHPAEKADVERAFDTAYHYAVDLRAMGFRLGKLEGRYPEAAHVYERILGINENDAYAWEYLGYNLALEHRNKPMPDDVRQRILAAYDNAITYDRNPDNPLYHGRLLGFRARLGEDIRREFGQRMRRYGRSEPAVSFFAEAVLQGVPRAERRALIEPWVELVRKNPRLTRLVKEAA